MSDKQKSDSSSNKPDRPPKVNGPGITTSQNNWDINQTDNTKSCPTGSNNNKNKPSK